MLTLQVLLATYPNTAAFRLGALTSDLFRPEFADVKQANAGFKALVREQGFDAGELAIVTYLQAKAAGLPYVLLPAVIVGRSQHSCLIYNPAQGEFHPLQLTGRRVGVRAYTQTTGAWLRAILEEEYGLDYTRVRWVTFEEPHVSGYEDPPWVERAAPGKHLEQMLRDGEIDAAIFGNELPGPPLRPLIRNPEKEASAWAARHGGVPINHMMVVRTSIAKERPDVVSELYRLLLASRDAAGTAVDHKAIRFGIIEVTPILEVIIDYAFQQRLIPRRSTVDELFDGLRSLP